MNTLNTTGIFNLKCVRPCRVIIAKFGVMEIEATKDKDLSSLKLYLKTTVKYTEIVQDYPITTMLAGKRKNGFTKKPCHESTKISSRIWGLCWPAAWILSV